MTNTTTDTHAHLRRLVRRRMGYDELERNHEEAISHLRDAVNDPDADYALAKATEDAYRYERVRRKIERETPDVGVKIDGYR